VAVWRATPNASHHARASSHVACMALLGLAEIFKVVHPTLDNILFHARRNERLIPFLANELIQISCAVPAGDHDVFVRRPLCWLADIHPGQPIMRFDQRNGDFLKILLKGCSQFWFDLNAKYPCDQAISLAQRIPKCKASGMQESRTGRVLSYFA